MLFRFLVIILFVIGGYFSFEIIRFHTNSVPPLETPQYLVQNAQNPQAEDKITIVEFLDYHCSSCQKAHKPLQEVLRDNKNIEYIVRPVPVIGDTSEELVKLSLAAGHMGKFWELHHALMRFPAGNLTQEQIRSAVAKANLNFEELSKFAQSAKVRRDFQKNINAAIAINLDAAPTFLINETKFIPRDENLRSQDLQKIIDDVSQ